MEVAPETIGGFTFSRKAAGEIFESILQALSEAASGEEGAAAASERMGLEQDTAKFIRDLRRLIQVLPHLRLGTLDAHIARLLSAVSIEIGLPAEFALQDELSSQQVVLRWEILNRLFGSHGLDADKIHLFLEMFDQATFGKTDKSFSRPVLKFVEDHRSIFHSHPRRSAWEGPTLSSDPLRLSSEQVSELTKHITELLQGMEMNATARKSLVTLVNQCGSYTSGSVWSRQMKGSSKILDFVFEGNDPELVYRGKAIDCTGPIWEGLQQLADHVCAIEWDKARTRTLGMWGFMALFEAAYRETAFPSGQMTFEDASVLLSTVHHLSPMELAYRLDGEIDHWLLDEFQDTSQPQWNVLEPFLSEVIQDPEHRRSLFLVGDVKQAIYGWRGGDAELFEHVQEEWPGMVTTTMATSFRSAPAVLEAVNAVFAGLPGDGPIPETVAERWRKAFVPHQAAREDLSGEAMIYTLEKDPLMEQALIVEYLRGLPEGCETALLVQDNTQGNNWAQFLRSEGFQVSREGSSPLRGSRGLEVLLAALRWAAHPGDTVSQRLVEMAGMEFQGFDLLQRCQNEGLAAVIRFLRSRLTLDGEDAYTRNRLDLLHTEALEFDAHHPPNLDRFLQHIEGLHLKETGGGEGIRIMTVHQSKGLGFDAVILPLKTAAGFSVRLEGLQASPPGVDPAWVSLLPPKAVCQRIPELQELRVHAEEREIYETLCVLYVAMTRAKRSLLVTLPPPGKSENTFGHWIPQRLGLDPEPGLKPLMTWGSSAWKTTLKPDRPVEPSPPPPVPFTEGPLPIQRLEPSREEAAKVQVGREFQFHEQDARDIGTRVHAVMEQVDDTEGSLEAFLASLEEELPEEIRQHVEGAWGMQELKRPEGVTEVWKEQKFETLLPEGWVTGIFDRVVLFEDHAWIQDFKTNRTVNEATVEHYRPQMTLYRRVLADMLGFEEDRIICHLLFTHTGTVTTL